MRLPIRQGEACGLSLMKFTLLFEGALKANGSPAKKQAIRDKLHPQLDDLWRTHPCLKMMRNRHYIATDGDGFMWFETHHSVPPVDQEIP